MPWAQARAGSSPTSGIKRVKLTALSRGELVQVTSGQQPLKLVAESSGFKVNSLEPTRPFVDCVSSVFTVCSLIMRT